MEGASALSADRSPAEVAVCERGCCAMIFMQFYLPCLVHASYIIGDEATGTAAPGHSRSHAARARSEVHRRQFEHPAQSSKGKSGKAAEGSCPARLLCGRIPVISRSKFVAR